MKLDNRDISILQVLGREGRISKTALAERVNLSSTACWDRLQRLEKAGAIEFYAARIALKKLAPHVNVFVLAELGTHRAESFQKFEAVVARHDEISGCWALGGGFDYLMMITTRDIDSYQRLMDTLLEQQAGLTRYFTYIVTKAVKDAPPPLAALIAATDD
ncbi:Lrp/AsnC family transcriptional regulator [Rhodobacteraceae bacterium F11138]|nr:Lrp/AsnC family transcriptional regulator [Rhodobacteraceae bacterium F11138]